MEQVRQSHWPKNKTEFHIAITSVATDKLTDFSYLMESL